MIVLWVKSIECMVPGKGDVETVHGRSDAHPEPELVIIGISCNLQESPAHPRWVIPPEQGTHIQGRVLQGHGLQVHDVDLSIRGEDPVRVAYVVVADGQAVRREQVY